LIYSREDQKKPLFTEAPSRALLALKSNEGVFYSPCSSSPQILLLPQQKIAGFIVDKS
jgi:hypothetical protein